MSRLILSIKPTRNPLSIFMTQMTRYAKLILIIDCCCRFKGEGTVSSPEGRIQINKSLFQAYLLLTVSPAFFIVFHVSRESEIYPQKTNKQTNHNSSQLFNNLTSIFSAVWCQLTFHFLRETCLDRLAKESNTYLAQTFPKLTTFRWEPGNTWHTAMYYSFVYMFLSAGDSHSTLNGKLLTHCWILNA